MRPRRNPRRLPRRARDALRLRVRGLDVAAPGLPAPARAAAAARALRTSSSVDPARRAGRAADYFGNAGDHFTVLTPAHRAPRRGRSLVEVHAAGPAGPRAEPALGGGARRAGLPQGRAGHPSRPVRLRVARTSPSVPSWRTSRGARFPPGRPLLAAAIDLMHRIHAEFRFDPAATTITTPVAARARGAAGRLPGLRAPADRLPALPGTGRALRERLPPHRSAARAAAARRRRRLSRLALGALPPARLGRPRSHERRAFPIGATSRSRGAATTAT